MSSAPHIADRLLALLAGALPPAEQDRAQAHLATCAECREELELLQSARGVFQPLPPVEPRAGFAAMVALQARDLGQNSFAQWLRWAFGGLALAGAAAAALIVALPAAPASREVMIAQRLDLFEDMVLMENQQALEDLEVVAVLHQLQQEARP